MTKTGFGEHLRREREMRGVSLDEICAATRIGTRFLQAMEAEEWERLPGGVFNRGFVRAVARYLGLDEEGMVAEYVMAMNQNGSAPVSVPQPEKRLLQRQTNWLPWIGAGVLISLLIAAGFAWRLYSARRTRLTAAQSASQPSEIPPAPPATPQPVVPAPAVAPVTPPPATSVAPADAAPPAASDKLQLKIEAGKATSVTVTADGKIVFDGTFIPGQSRSFEAQTQFDVAAKDAGALLLELNSKTLAPIGPPGHPGKVSLTRRTLESAAGGAN